MLARKDLKPLARQFFIGGLCFALNLGLMWYLIERLEFSVLWATVVCFFAINAVGHHLSRRWTFKIRSSHYFGSFFRFFLVMAISLALNVGLMYSLVVIFRWPYLFASGLIALLFFLANFLAHRDWTYAK